jgi:hypothetical protein
MESIKVVISILILIIASFSIGKCEGKKAIIPVCDERVDTLVIRDTITQYEPIYKEIHKVEKVLVPVVDTMRVIDTLYVYLEREQVVWQDSLSRVYASGILPQIDSVQHYITERIVTNEVTIQVKKPCRWGVGVHAGYGAGLSNGKVIVSPYIGVGISYNIISW